MSSLRDAVSRKRPNEDAQEKIESGGRDEMRLNVRMSTRLYEQLQSRAEGEGRSISWVIRQYAHHYANGGDLP